MPTDTVFIVDDDASVRDALSLLLSLHSYATATFATAEDFLVAWQPDWRGCMVIDIRMPGMSGLALQERLKRQDAGLPVIIITAHGDVAAARQAFLADAVDFIEKPFDAAQFLAAVQKALARLPAPPASHSPAAAQPGRLSAREREVMQLMVQGLHNRQIAQALGISPRTVEVHKARVMEKLAVDNVVELVRLVDRNGA